MFLSKFSWGFDGGCLRVLIYMCVGIFSRSTHRRNRGCFWAPSIVIFFLRNQQSARYDIIIQTAVCQARRQIPFSTSRIYGVHDLKIQSDSQLIGFVSFISRQQWWCGQIYGMWLGSGLALYIYIRLHGLLNLNNTLTFDRISLRCVSVCLCGFQHFFCNSMCSVYVH